MESHLASSGVRGYSHEDTTFSGYSIVASAATYACPLPVTNTVGLYRDGTSIFRDANSTGITYLAFAFAAKEGGWTPLVGDWDGDGVDGIGLYKDGMWMLRNRASSGTRDVAFSFNPLGSGALPVVGDWNADGVDSIGLYKDGMRTLRNSNSAGKHDIAFNFTVQGVGDLQLEMGTVIAWILLDCIKEGTWYLHNKLMDQSVKIERILSVR